MRRSVRDFGDRLAPGSAALLAWFAIALLGTGCGGGGRPDGGPIPVRDTIRTLTGEVRYMTTGPTLAGRRADGRMPVSTGFVDSTFGALARELPVEVRRPDGSLLASGMTNASGVYSITLNFGPAPATPVSIHIEARLDIPGSVARVFPDETTTVPYRHSSPLGGNPADSVMRINLTVPLADGAAAYHIINALASGYFAGHSGIGAFPELDVYWKPGNGALSSFRGEGGRGKLLVAGGITGDPASNTDCWDAPKLMRLFGEYLLHFFYLETAPAGAPSEALLVPSAAWREGFLDWWACHGRDSRIFWDTEGLGAEGRLTRFYDIESFFDPALGSLGPGDPNVYQDPSVIGIGSSFTVSEMLWDIHDANGPGTDGDRLEFPIFLTFSFLSGPRSGIDYPYLFTLLDRYASDNSIHPGALELLGKEPEDQGITYPGSVDNGLIWPPRLAPANRPSGGWPPLHADGLGRRGHAHPHAAERGDRPALPAVLPH